MSCQSAAWLAWSLAAVCAVLIALALLLDFVTDVVPVQPEERRGPILAVLTAMLSLAYPTVGALIVSRLPANPIGWIFCGAGLLYVTQHFTVAYADYALLENIALPWGESVAWFSQWLGFATPTLGVFLMLLFPDGRLQGLVGTYRSGGSALISFLLSELARFTGGDWEKEDDITLVTLERLEEL
jgi:hypothetical protein